MDPELTDFHPCVTGINSALCQLTEKINDGVRRKFYINVPIKIEQELKFSNALTTKAGSTILNLRVQGITNNFAEDVKTTGAIFKRDF